MKFGHLFEFHKIPDWYTEYVHYKELKGRIEQFKALIGEGQTKSLKGYWMINKNGQLYSIDFIKDMKAAKADGHSKSKQRVLSLSGLPIHNSNDQLGGNSHQSDLLSTEEVQNINLRNSHNLARGHFSKQTTRTVTSSGEPGESNDGDDSFNFEQKEGDLNNGKTGKDKGIEPEEDEESKMPNFGKGHSSSADLSDQLASRLSNNFGKPRTKSGRILTDSMRTKLK